MSPFFIAKLHHLSPSAEKLRHPSPLLATKKKKFHIGESNPGRLGESEKS